MANEFIVRKGIKSLGGVTFPYTGVTDTCTIGPNEYLINAPSGTFTITLPSAGSISGKQYIIKNSGNGVITLNTTSSQTIDGNLSISLTQNDTVEVISDGSNWKIVSGIGDIVVELAMFIGLLVLFKCHLINVNTIKRKITITG